MARQQRIRIFVEGELGQALYWEAGRRGVSPKDLVLRLIETDSAEILRHWQEASTGNRHSPPVPSVGQAGAFESVLLKAYGPNGRIQT